MLLAYLQSTMIFLETLLLYKSNKLRKPWRVTLFFLYYKKFCLWYLNIFEPLFVFYLQFVLQYCMCVWCLKTAEVISIPKTTPVSKDQWHQFLCFLSSAVNEKTVMKTKMKRCYDNSHFTCRKNSSTICALIILQDCIFRCHNDSDICADRILIFRMSDAIDSVLHEILANSEHQKFVDKLSLSLKAARDIWRNNKFFLQSCYW